MASSMQASVPSTSNRCAGQQPRCRLSFAGRHLRSHTRRAVEREVDWEADLRKAPSSAPPRGFSPPPPPPPPPASVESFSFPDGPFTSRRNIALTMLGGSALYWLLQHTSPIEFADRPDVDFKLAGYTDLNPEDFAYFKTPEGNWVAAAQDERGRLFMIDEIGDLYYDSGDPEIGLYAMDTQGNLFNFYKDTDGSRRITPVGNVGDMRKFKISEIAGIKLDRDVNVVAFEDGRSLELPLGSGVRTPDGRVLPPAEIVEGVGMPKQGVFDLFGGNEKRMYPLERPTVDLEDTRGFDRQLYDQTFLDDPDIPGWQPSLPDDFDIEALGREVLEEFRDNKTPGF